MKALHLSRTHYGESADLSGILSERLGRLYLVIGKLDKSDAYLNEAIKITRKCHGINSELNVKPLKALIDLSLAQARIPLAHQFLVEAMKIAKATESEYLKELEKKAMDIGFKSSK